MTLPDQSNSDVLRAAANILENAGVVIGLPGVMSVEWMRAYADRLEDPLRERDAAWGADTEL